MKHQEYPDHHTSNDLLNKLTEKPLNYDVVAQSVEEVQNTHRAPAISIGPYLIESGQTKLINSISIYSQLGKHRDQVRLLYMNAVAMRVWKAMGNQPTLIGKQFRPPKTALLAYGVPFSE